MRLTARVTSISVRGFKLAHSTGGCPIEGPHWRAESPQTRRAAAVQAARDAAVDVEIEVSGAEGAVPDWRLNGDLGAIRVRTEAPFRLKVGSNRIRALLRGPDRGFQHHSGRLAWSLCADDGSYLDLGRTPVEIFELFARLFVLYSKGHGVPLDVLRFLSGPISLAGLRSKHLAIAAVARYCHAGHGLRYSSRSWFVSRECKGTFALSRYLQQDLGRANCYDQANALQTLAGAIGIKVENRRMWKFGFVTVQHLVGVGPTNNPGELPRFIRGEQPGAFANHGFCWYQGGVFDACLGPFLGDLSPDQYLSEVIDSSFPDPARGVTRDIKPCAGAIEVT